MISRTNKYFSFVRDRNCFEGTFFVIDKEGIIIQHSTINNLAIGRSVDVTMRKLQVILSPNWKRKDSVFSSSALKYCFPYEIWSPTPKAESMTVCICGSCNVRENPDEVCPAGWKPGEKSMRPDTKLSSEYFCILHAGIWRAWQPWIWSGFLPYYIVGQSAYKIFVSECLTIFLVTYDFLSIVSLTRFPE